MQTKIIQFGNSKGVIIPSQLTSELGLNVGDLLEIKEKNKHLILKKSYEELELNLAEMFNKFEKENGPIKKIKENEFEWGKVKGDEVW